MTKKQYQNCIEYRVNFINEKLGTKYKAEYNDSYGGWNLYLIREEGGVTRGTIGFDGRKSNREFLAYVDGIYNLLSNYNVEPTKEGKIRDLKC